MHLSAHCEAPGEPAATAAAETKSAAPQQTLMQKSARVREEMGLKSKQHLVP